MRVAVVGEYVAGATEGMAIASKGLAAALGALSEVVDLTAAAETGSARTAVLACITRLRRAPVDVVYYLPKSGLTAASLARAQLLRRSLRRPVVVGCLQADDSTRRVHCPFQPDAIVVPTRRLADVLQRRGIRADVAGIGLDRARFSPTGHEAVYLWPDKPGPRVLHVGHLAPSRNLGLLASMSRAGFNCLVVASPSTPAHPPVAELLAAAGITVIRERLPEIAAVYRAADLYAFPVEHPRGCIEVPLSVLEAIACGTPVLSTGFGGIPELAAVFSGITISSGDRFVDGASVAMNTDPSVHPVPDWSDVGPTHLRVLERVVEERRRPRLVVLLGVDGTGKSTQARLLVEDAASRGVDAAAIWSRWRPLLLRPLMSVGKRLMGGRSVSPAEGYDRSMSLKRNVFRVRGARVVWQWIASIDHAIQSIPRIAAARRRHAFVVADRYYHDALVDMAANFGSVVPNPRGAFRLFPKPDRVIVLDAPETVAIGRKDDIPSLRYLEQRRPLYLELAKRNGWPVVDATGTEGEVSARINVIVWSKP